MILRHPDLPAEQTVETDSESFAAVLAKSGWEPVADELADVTDPGDVNPDPAPAGLTKE